MLNFVYALMSIICFILGGVSTYFAANSYKAKRWGMFIYDISLILLNLYVMFTCLIIVFR